MAEDDLYEGILQDAQHGLAETLKKTFMPWHKPRKQWVRKNQWHRETVNLIQMFASRPDAISYLSLPGSDMLDIRSLHDVCEAENIKLRYLGFNIATSTDDDKNNLVISESEVSRLPFVDDEQSRIVSDKLESIALEDSLAYENARRAAPFDIINIDLCNSVWPRGQVEGLNIFDSIATIVALQKRTRVEPWVMFLTTRSRKGKVDESVIERFLEHIEANCEDYSEFEEKMTETIALTLADIARLRESLKLIQDDEFKSVFIVGLTKWIISLTNGSDPKWSTTMLDSCFYDIRAGHKDMISYAFLFELQHSGVSDPKELATTIAGAAPSYIEEKDQALQALHQVKSMQDVDDHLEKNTILNEEMVLESRQLMEAARYDGDEYVAWVARGFEAG